jgi:GNAT superfamily N-acetyltransferase
LGALLDAGDVRWRPDQPAQRPGLAHGRMTLTDPAGGAYEVVRGAPAFTPAEYARAQALMEVSGAVLRQHAQHATLLLPDGAELLIRPAGPDDADAVRRLHGRSSVATLGRRYRAGPPSDARLRRLLTPAGGLTLLAQHGDEVVAMANLLVEGDLGEVALLVEDAWQRRGVGTALLRRVMEYARHADFAAVVAHAGADNVAMLRTLRRLGAGTTDRDGPMLSVTLPVPHKADVTR